MKSKLLVLLFFVVMSLLLICACTNYNSDDGKCDICGEESKYKLKEEEYCYKHLGDAAAWYLNQ